MMSVPESHQLLQQYQAGRSEAAAAIFDRYVARLIALARSRMSPRRRRRIDAEDVVQSAYRSFFLHASEGEYSVANSGDLWRLLASITLHKLHGQIEKQTAAKRNFTQEEAADTGLSEFSVPEPSPGEVVAIVEQLHLVVGQLIDEARDVLLARMRGERIEEIAAAINKSPRTVRRLLAQAKELIEGQLLRDDVSTGGVRKLQRGHFPEPHAPLQYSDYLLEQLIGAGGMGKVYRAREVSSGRTVAVKALHKARQIDERAVTQFVQEADVLRKLQHPNIVSVQGLGRFPGGGYFLVMEYVDGIDLQKRVRGGPLSVAETVSILKDVASAVSHAHDHSIVHCDLKPANVLVARDGRVLVTDFGFAYIAVGGADSLAGILGGTQGYLAPEILRLGYRPTPAADVYALGVLLWELATGKSPDERDSIHAADDALEPVLSVCRRCLVEEPCERFTSVGDLVRALDQL